MRDVEVASSGHLFVACMYANLVSAVSFCPKAGASLCRVFCRFIAHAIDAVPYPAYTIQRTGSVFHTRAQLLAYEAALKQVHD